MASVNIPIISEFDAKGTQKAIKEFQSLEGASKKAQFAIKKAAVPAAAALAGLGVALVGATKAAMEDEAEQAQLALALENVTGATDEQVKATEDMISKMSRASGVADSELRPAFASLVRGTKDIATATDALALAQDISAGSGKDLATVSDALAKAYGGNMKGLQALSPEIKAMIKDGASLEDVINALGGSFGGAAKVAAETAAGQFKILNNSLDETKEAIGAALIPVVEAGLPHLQKFADWAQNNPDAFVKIAAAIGAVAASIVAVNIAMSLNPFVIAATGIVAMAVGFNKLADAMDRINKVGGFAARLLGGLVLPVVGQVANILKGAGNFLNSDDKPGSPSSVIEIPKMAKGGIVNSATVALIGEKGPEMVVPLNGRGNGMGNYTININGGLGSSAEIGTAVVNAIRAFNRQNGPANIAVA
jgi:hypothetical protein